MLPSLSNIKQIYKNRKNKNVLVSSSLLLLMLMPHKKSRTKSPFPNLLKYFVLLHVVYDYFPFLRYRPKGSSPITHSQNHLLYQKYSNVYKHEKILRGTRKKKASES